METVRKINESMLNDLNMEEDMVYSNERHQLLIIDDNLEVLSALIVVLKDHYRVLPCATFGEALSFAGDVEVALLDIKMAIKDGTEVFKLLKRINPKIRIIFHSAYPGDISQAAVASTLPHDGYLIKGDYTISDMLEIIAAALHKNSV